jgi:hypothetical protein
MSSSAPEEPRAGSVEAVGGQLAVRLEDGRTVSIPLEWFPKLRDATATQLADRRLIGQGRGRTHVDSQWPIEFFPLQLRRYQ